MLEFLTQPPAQPAPAKPSAQAAPSKAQSQDSEAPAKEATFADALNDLNDDPQTKTPHSNDAAQTVETPAIETPAIHVTAQASTAAQETMPDLHHMATTTETETLNAFDADEVAAISIEGSDSIMAPVDATDAPTDSDVEAMPVIALAAQVDDGVPASSAKTAIVLEDAPLELASQEDAPVNADAAAIPAIEISQTHDAQTAAPVAVAAVAATLAAPSTQNTVPKGLAPKADTQPLSQTPTLGGDALQPLTAGESPTHDGDLAHALDVADQELTVAQDKALKTADKSALMSSAAPTFDQTMAAANTDNAADPALLMTAAKNTIAETPSAKPLPEVIVQVPQQRADMAAKQVGLELARQVKNAHSLFVVRMDPPELGKLDVRITVSKAGEVQANIIVEREATLDLLNKDARTLERSLTDAGLKMEQNALNLSLKQNDSEGFGKAMANADGTTDVAGDEAGDDDDMMEVIDGAALAQMQIASGRPLDVTV